MKLRALAWGIAAWCIILLAVVTISKASPIPAPMGAAIDRYAMGYATWQGPAWTYTGRRYIRGDYRHAYVTLTFHTTTPGTIDGVPAIFPVTWYVGIRAARCGPGWYAIAAPNDTTTTTCQPTTLPPW